jgi:GDP-L-fucose synthase
MDKNSKIYVAGHRGLVGSAIVRKLIHDGYSELLMLTSKELDLRRQEDTERFFKEKRPEYVFLAAAKVGGIIANSTYKAEFIYDNILIAANIIHSAYKNGIQKVFNLGSTCIYPRLSPQPMREEHLLTGSLEPTNEPYAIAKISAIKMCRYYNEQYGTNFISVMPTNLYGPNDNFNFETSHVLPALIRKFHLAKLLANDEFDEIAKDIQNYPLGFGLDKKVNLEDRKSIKNVLVEFGINKNSVVLWGSGEPLREFLFVDDLADACVFLMENYSYKDIGEFINIGTGEEIKIKDLAALIKDVVGFKGQIQYDHTKPDGMPRKVTDVSRMKELRWEAKTTLEVGLRKTYEWYTASVNHF